VKPIVLAMLARAWSAHMLAPLPRWSTTVFPLAARSSNFGSTEAMYSYEIPWKP
jgi:hypothetical protein